MKYVLLLLLLFNYREISPMKRYVILNNKDYYKCKELTLENVKQYLELTSIKHKEIVIKQVILETGWLQSYNCKVRNNLFGFLRIDIGYYSYNHWTESINHYERWQKIYYKDQDYYEFLQKLPYAEDPKYIFKLKQIKL